MDGALAVAEVTIIKEKRAFIVDIPVANGFALPTQWSSMNIAAVWGLACFEEPVVKSALCMPLKCMKITALLAWAWPIVT